MLIVGDVYALINYVMFTDSVFLLATVSGLLWLRWKRPNVHRPIKVGSIYRLNIQFKDFILFFKLQVNLAYPLAFMLVSIFLVCFPIVSNPVGAATAIGITATAIPIFCFCIAWKRKPKWVSSSNSKDIIITINFQFYCYI